jgi:hypothetical protein
MHSINPLNLIKIIRNKKFVYYTQLRPIFHFSDEELFNYKDLYKYLKTNLNGVQHFGFDKINQPEKKAMLVRLFEKLE